MIKTILIAVIYFLIGMGIVAAGKSDKKNDPGYIAFVLLFWPLIVGILLIICALAFICAGLSMLNKKGKDE